MTESRAGEIVALGTLAHAPGVLLGGKLADRFGRKRVIVAARVLSALALVPAALPAASAAIPWLVVGAVLASSLAVPATTALVADVTEPAERATAYSLVYLGHNLGFAVGPLIAGLLFREHLALLFLGDALTSLLAAVLVVLFVRDPFSEPRDDGGGPTGSVVGAFLARPAALAFFGAMGAYSLVFVQAIFALPLAARAQFGEHGPARYGMLMTLNGALIVLLSPVVVRITRHVATTRLIAIGGVAYAVGFGALGLRPSFALFAASTIVWTLGEILVVTNQKVLIAAWAPAHVRGRFAAVAELTSGAGYTLGPLLAGRIVGGFGLDAVGAGCFGVGLLAALAIVAIGSLDRHLSGDR